MSRRFIARPPELRCGFSAAATVSFHKKKAGRKFRFRPASLAT
jgi:hypothetical protein